eukprot:TRINITY_DN8428_c0_g1_i1.p1 TRINITY_DN8428_c0_g1~~TRINITY_DN8428_c0_g1_i1.p1  ORF type:complete len:717 (+),score=106.65 TRINITY_DN8428_c0_g1_i1:73-2223(+)
MCCPWRSWRLALAPPARTLLVAVAASSLLLPVRARVASELGNGACLIGSRSEAREVLPGVAFDSTCCAAAELYLARRSGGYCPDLSGSSGGSNLPFAPHCHLDGSLDDAYVPDVATARSAAHELCRSDAGLVIGCSGVVADFVQRLPHLAPRSGAPHCEEILQNDGSVDPTVWLERMALSVVMTVATAGLLLGFHLWLAPRWIRARLARLQGGTADEGTSKAAGLAAADPTLPGPANSVALADVGVGLDLDAATHAGPISHKSKVAGGLAPSSLPTAGNETQPAADAVPPEEDRRAPPNPPPPLGPPPRTFGNGGPNGAEALGTLIAAATAAALTEAEVEEAATLRLKRARLRCRAHISLLCAAALGITLGRMSLTMALTSFAGAEGPPSLVLSLLCVWQVAILARASQLGFSQAVPGSPKSPQSTAGDFVARCPLLGGLRAFAISTLLCELFIVVSAGLTKEERGSLGSSTDASLSDHEPLKPLGQFLMEQLARSFCLARLYVAWLAYSLHRVRRQLQLMVLPSSPEAMLVARKLPEDDRPAAVDDVMAMTWDPDDETEEGMRAAIRSGRKRARQRALTAAGCAIGAVTAGTAVGLWRGYSNSANSDRDTSISSCRTAGRGVDFCAPMEFLGHFVEMETMEECCASCDAAAACQAWTFLESTDSENTLGKCWKLRFDEAPCRGRPSHSSCRCRTNARKFGGFKASLGDRIWAGDG